MVAVAAAVALAVGAATQSLCFMPAPRDPSGTGAHDCCEMGLSAMPPACCLLSRAPAAQARLAPPTCAKPMLAPAGAASPVEAPAPLRAAPRLAATASHSPPPTVLRI